MILILIILIWIGIMFVKLWNNEIPFTFTILDLIFTCNFRIRKLDYVNDFVVFLGINGVYYKKDNHIISCLTGVSTEIESEMLKIPVITLGFRITTSQTIS